MSEIKKYPIPKFSIGQTVYQIIDTDLNSDDKDICPFLISKINVDFNGETYYFNKDNTEEEPYLYSTIKDAIDFLNLILNRLNNPTS